MKNKDLLLKDLCGRLPYGIKCSFGVDDSIYEITGINPSCCGASEIQATHIKSGINGDFRLSSCKPYLFPMLSMNEEQKNFIRFKLTTPKHDSFDEDSLEDLIHNNIQVVRFCYENHLDINGLIPMGLAIDATNLNIY